MNVSLPFQISLPLSLSHTHTHTHTHTHARTHARTRARTHTCAHTHVYMYTHTHTQCDTDSDTCIHAHTNIHTLTYNTHSHLHTRAESKRYLRCIIYVTYVLSFFLFFLSSNCLSSIEKQLSTAKESSREVKVSCRQNIKLSNFDIHAYVFLSQLSCFLSLDCSLFFHLF